MSKVDLVRLTSMRNSGLTLQVIADYFGVSKQYISDLCCQLGLTKKWRTKKDFSRDEWFEKYGFWPEEKELFSTPEHMKIRLLLSQAKLRAKDFDLEWGLKLGDFKKLPTHCPVLGIELNYLTGTRGDRYSSPSIDRKDSSKGYTKDNVEIISWRANFLKSDGTADEFKKLSAYLDKK